MREYHVAINGDDFAEGSKEQPFRTISKAAKVALAGDHVIVHEGVYREWVRPAHSGSNDYKRIVYEAAEGEKVVNQGIRTDSVLGAGRGECVEGSTSG